MIIKFIKIIFLALILLPINITTANKTVNTNDFIDNIHSKSYLAQDIPDKPSNTVNSQINNKHPKVDLVLAENFKQGGSIIVYVNSPRLLTNPKISFMNKVTDLYKLSDTKYRGLVGVDVSTKPGIYTLKTSDLSGMLNYSKEIKLNDGKYPIQNIRISGSKASLEPTKDELEKVSAAKNNVTKDSFWETRPFESPTKGCIASVYGLNRYHNGKPTDDFHKGLDIRAPQGNPIIAITDGKVLIAEKFRLHGGTVSIDHGQGLMSIYIHMSKISVKPGEIVKKGQKIGEVGSTGFATGPHLHWGLYIFGIPINPTEWTKPVKKC